MFINHNRKKINKRKGKNSIFIEINKNDEAKFFTRKIIEKQRHKVV